ncbi:hypothetical protein EG240_12725 [Paenimyroides tangerinum]|uniref:Uncharacterized protein n=1 Tax=Paenimyroides tangerinum TaxID=2488728 RepID=A0A3P3W1Y6_9FLAO|nr:hypothetical protein [Paenimyroides tangerinum]RRJ89055.1 hypothetical protein EG240_12725 [Paenimyroides tangerinum]
MKKLILICSLCFSIFGYSQEDILKDPEFKEYEKEVVAFMTSKDYLNYEKLKKVWLYPSSSDIDFSSDEVKKEFRTKLKEAYDVISDKEKEITKMRVDLIEKYTQEVFLTTNKVINQQVYQINYPYYKSIYE